MTNIYNQLNDHAIIVENFIKHPEPDDDGPDLLSAARERDSYYSFLNEKCKN